MVVCLKVFANENKVKYSENYVLSVSNIKLIIDVSFVEYVPCSKSSVSSYTNPQLVMPCASQ